MRNRTFRSLLIAMVVLAVPTVTVFARGAWYHGIHIAYQAGSIAHFGRWWLSTGDILAAQNVDQIGSTFWSTVEKCGDDFNWASFYSFNGHINYNSDSYSNDFFRGRYGCDGNQVNRFRTYIRFYVQDYPYSGKEYVDTDWATW